MKPLGGQALIEGVMIKSPTAVTMAARTPNGLIVSRKKKHVSLTAKSRFWKLPLLRGMVILGEMLVVGIDALNWSASQQGEEETLGVWQWGVTIVFAVGVTIGLFVLLPFYLAKWLFGMGLLFGLFEGIVRLAIFLLYLVGIGLMQDVRRMFEYHGAEHMAVHCYENKKELSVKNVARYSPQHARCGTSLLFFVVMVSIVLFSLIPTGAWYYHVVLRIVLIPLIAGIAYELLKLSAKQKWLAWCTYPGLLIQKLTTRVPSSDQIEVAIVALNKAK